MTAAVGFPYLTAGRVRIGLVQLGDLPASAVEGELIYRIILIMMSWRKPAFTTHLSSFAQQSRV